MASSHSKSNSKNNASKTLAETSERIRRFGQEILGFSHEIIKVISNNPVAATIAGTVLVSPVAYNALTPQANMAFQELGANQQEILNRFLDQTTELLNHAAIDSSNNQPDENIKRLLKAHSFTALRSLDGRGKGRLLRFLSENELINVNQSAMSLSGADLRDIDLQNAWIPKINLNGAYVLNGDLQNVNLTGSHLEGTNLTGSNLTNANLTNANLAGANLTDANLADANLTDTNLTDANLDIDKAIQDGAKFCRTIMPDGNLSPSSCPE